MSVVKSRQSDEVVQLTLLHSFLVPPLIAWVVKLAESAIVLDLLMSLPEELPLLDCNKLHKHLVQVYQCLSSPADSKIAREMFKDLKDGLCAQTEAPSGRDSNRTNSQQNTAGTADSSDVTDSGEKKLQPDEAESQSSGNTSSQSEDADVMGVCPPLNPFMVPLKLLMRQ